MGNASAAGLLLGLPEAKYARMTEQARATGLGEGLDVPIRTYSAGMSVRLSLIRRAMQLEYGLVVADLPVADNHRRLMTSQFLLLK